MGVYRYAYVWSPFQRLYLPAYVYSQVAGTFVSSGQYRLLHVVGKNGSRMALEAEVEQVPRATGEPTYVPSQLGTQYGARRIAWVVDTRDHCVLHDDLQRYIYNDQSLVDLMRPALWDAIVVLVGGLLIALPMDAARARDLRRGRRLKGPELLTLRRFNRRLDANGLAFYQTPRGFARLSRRRPAVRLPSALEPSHILIMGDSDAGKSILLGDILEQIRARGDTAIVYDPALAYTGHFYDPACGDLILNPLDTRSPYWSPGDEVRDHVETTALATALFQEQPHDYRFFTETSRGIVAHLLTYRPSAQAMVEWLSNRDELTRRLQGTPYASMVDPMAPHHHVGVIASLNTVADALKLLPTTDQASGRWSASAWAKRFEGWLFLTSTPESRERLRPLTSLWLDLLILRVLRAGFSGRHVWFVLDDVANLHQLPQLKTAITEDRKANCLMVLGLQGRSRFDMRYGHHAEAILSQPAAKLFLRTSEPRAAQWISDTIGLVEIERLRDGRSPGYHPHHRFGIRQTEPLVMASEISGLPNLRGFLKVLNLVVRLDVAPAERHDRHPAFLPRALPPLTTSIDGRPTDVDTAAEPSAAPEEHQSPEQSPSADTEPVREEFFR